MTGADATAVAARLALTTAARHAPDGLESRIAGTSMAPTLRDGVPIRVVWVPDAIVDGAVVACLSAGNSLFAHRVARRVTRRGRDYVLTLGDGWLLCDPPTPLDDVVGIVARYRDGEHWRAPAAAPRRPVGSALIARTSLLCVDAALRVHPWIARRVAGTALVVGAWCKSLRRRWRGARPPCKA